MFDLSTFTPWSLFTDFGIISILILIAKFLRVKIKIIQKLFIPPSLIAGLLGLGLGPNGAGWLPLSGNLGTYSAVFIALVFAALPFSSPSMPFKQVVKKLGPIWSFAQMGMLLQWGIMGLFGFFVLKLIWPGLNDAFGIMLPTGFYGGHGTAAAIGTAFEGLGWDEAKSLGMTTATVGIISAIIGGLLILKVAARKKYTSFIYPMYTSTKSSTPATSSIIRVGIRHFVTKNSIGDGGFFIFLRPKLNLPCPFLYLL